MFKRQRGITFIGFAIVLSVVVFAGFIGIRLFPIYQEYFSVVQSLNAVAAEPDVQSWTPSEIRRALGRRFDVNYIESVDVRQHVIINRADGGYNVGVQYEVRRPLIGNLDVVAIFNKQINLLER